MKPSKAYKLFNTILNLEKEVIGIKFLKNKEEYDAQEAKDVVNDMRYCVMVKSVMSGHSLKIRGQNFKCEGSGMTFGYHELPEGYYSGEPYYNNYRLHKDLETSKQVVNNMYIMDGETYGIVLKPLNEFTEDNTPDVVLIVANPYNAMRISQGYTYQYGLKKDFNIAGNQAVCLEGTAVPLIEDNINISMLCAGTRYSAKWNENELIIGISWNKVEGVLSGTVKTINTIEPDYKKEEIISKNGSNDINGEKIELGTAYFYSGSFN